MGQGTITPPGLTYTHWKKRNMKRKKQIRESKEMIVTAFKKLLGKADYKDITLTEIADHAGLTRMTLHRHFKNKEKIVHYIVNTVSQRAWENWDGDRSSLGEGILFMLNQIKQLPNRFILTESREIHELIKSYRSNRTTFIIEAIEKVTGISCEENRYMYYFITGGIENIFYEWLKGGCMETTIETRDRLVEFIEKFSIKNTEIR